MALILKKLYHGIFWLADLRDPRTDRYIIFNNPLYPIVLIASYILLVKRILPSYMEKRKPYNLKRILLVYNLVQIFANAYIFYELVKRIRWRYVLCFPIDYSYTEENFKMIEIGLLYCILKLLDLLDTVFFVLKKNFHQVSFLHVYHHCGMVLAAWIGMRFMASGHSMWVGFVNSFVHTLMFTYYFLSALNSEWKKNIKFKKFITQVQLAQFLFLFVSVSGAARPSCNFPSFCIVFAIQNIVMFAMFLNFYKKTYLKKKV